MKLTIEKEGASLKITTYPKLMPSVDTIGMLESALVIARLRLNIDVLNEDKRAMKKAKKKKK